MRVANMVSRAGNSPPKCSSHPTNYCVVLQSTSHSSLQGDNESTVSLPCLCLRHQLQLKDSGHDHRLNLKWMINRLE